MRTVATLPTIADLTAPPAPARLDSAPELQRSTTPAAVSRAQSGAIPIVVHVSDLPPSLRNESAGVATFAADTGADFVWTPLASATEAADGSLGLTSWAQGTGETVVTLATSRTTARHAYLARTTIRPGQRSSSNPADVDLRATISNVRFVLPEGADRAGPFRLVRVDDAQWLPMHHTATGITILAKEPQSVLLGAGSYELCDPLADDRRQRFDVPRSEPVLVKASMLADAHR
ncbi:MAG TPA: hypothetical protein VFZ65_07290 [Planctomycetota bacterium]|nr:hypothetical protein [Planctomycetota bacterium]